MIDCCKEAWERERGISLKDLCISFALLIIIIQMLNVREIIRLIHATITEQVFNLESIFPMPTAMSIC